MMQAMLGPKHLRFLAVFSSVLVGACLGASVTFNAAVNDVNANFNSGLPDIPMIPNVPCAGEAQCDALEIENLTYSCVANLCDPDPIVIEQVLSDVDFEELSAGVLSALSSVELKRARYDFTQNTNPLDVGPVDIFWGPAGVASINGMGVHKIGTFPGIPANTAPEGEIVLDDAGNDALTDYLGGSTTDVRFFGRTTIDLDPGDPIPASVTVDADFLFTIKASGDLI